MSISGNPVVLINRTSRILSFTADGQHYDLTPGENYGYNDRQARFAKNQNPLRGTEDYSTLRFQSLIAVKGTKDDASELDDETLKIAEEVSQGERFDRSTMGQGAQRVISKPNRHMPLGRIGGAGAGSGAFAIGE